MEDIRFFTPGQVRALLPRLKPLLVDLREAFHAHKFAREQLDDLRTQYQEDPLSPSFPLREEAERWKREADGQGQRVQVIVDELVAMGVDVKDPLLGLVDFFARRHGEVVLLCYRDDEPDLAWWHPLDAGFRGRRPLDEF